MVFQTSPPAGVYVVSVVNYVARNGQATSYEVEVVGAVNLTHSGVVSGRNGSRDIFTLTVP